MPFREKKKHNLDPFLQIRDLYLDCLLGSGTISTVCLWDNFILSDININHVQINWKIRLVFCIKETKTLNVFQNFISEILTSVTSSTRARGVNDKEFLDGTEPCIVEYRSAAFVYILCCAIITMKNTIWVGFFWEKVYKANFHRTCISIMNNYDHFMESDGDKSRPIINTCDNLFMI